MITRSAPARAGLLGNPSDGYGGKTLAVAVPAFSATVDLEPWDRIEIAPSPDDLASWSSLGALVDHVDRFGLGTGTQLLAATVRTFADVLDSVDGRLPGGLRLGYRSTIPRQVGLAGSSALVVATLGCLCDYAGLEIPEHVLPSIALRVETEQLGISAGLQDRVVQVYGGLVAMDFGSPEVDGAFGVSHGHYERLDASGLPPLFIAYREEAAEPSGNYHRLLRARFDQGDALVRDTMRQLAHLVTEGRAALRWHEAGRIGELIRENMALRARLGPLPESQLELVEVATLLDAPVTFTGSGGAVVGVHDDDEHLERLRVGYSVVGATVVEVAP